MKKAEFLRSKRSSPKLSGTKSQQQGFGKMLKKYREGKLSNSEAKREKSRKYIEVEKKSLNTLR